MAALLEDAGYEVAEAESLAEARRRIESERYNLAILDLQLGDGLGTELIPALAKQHPSVVVAILSGSDRPPMEGVALALTKSDAPAEILNQLKRALAEAHSSQGR